MKFHVCDMQTGQDELKEAIHGEAAFSSWPEMGMTGIVKRVKGWLCAECRVALNARLEEQPERKRAHGHRTREMEEVIE